VTPSEAQAIAEMTAIVRSHLGPDPCPNHRPVPRRILHFEMREDPLIPGHVIRRSGWHGGGNNQVITGHADGTGCPACDWFEPNP
jgi:hypothetical protein